MLKSFLHLIFSKYRFCTQLPEKPSYIVLLSVFNSLLTLSNDYPHPRNRQYKYVMDLRSWSQSSALLPHWPPLCHRNQLLLPSSLAVSPHDINLPVSEPCTHLVRSLISR